MIRFYCLIIIQFGDGYINRASDRLQKKSQILRDFLGQIHRKIGQFRGNFVEISGQTSPKSSR